MSNPTDERPARIAVYARVSSEDQAERGTITNQVEFATKYCDLHDLGAPAWYKDDGVTGTIPLEARPAGQQLLNDAKAGQFDLLLIYKLDRLGRSARIILNAVYELEQLGVKIRSMTEPFDTGDPSGRFLLTILAGVADLERETILQRLGLGANRAAREGKWLGGIVPYGYRLNPDGYLEVSEETIPEINMSEADVIRLVYRLLIEERYSTIQIADYLNALGIPTRYVRDDRLVVKGKRKTRTSGVWLPGRVRNMLVNSTYRGFHQYGKRSDKKRELIDRKVPPIVTDEIWYRAQRTLRENQLEACRNATHDYLLRGLIRCGMCGLHYCGTSFRGAGGKMQGYYVCNGKTSYRGPLQGKCISKNLIQADVERMVWDDCVRFIQDPGRTLDELAAGMADRESERDALVGEREQILTAIGNKESEKQSILDLYRRGLVRSLDVEKQLQKINLEQASLEARARELEEELRNEANVLDGKADVASFLAGLREKLQGDVSFATRREIVWALVSEVVVETTQDDDGKARATIHVQYSFSKALISTLNRARNTSDNERRLSIVRSARQPNRWD